MSNQEKFYTNINKRRVYGCNGKVDYGSWSAATRVAKQARGKGRSAGTIMTPYRCKVCSGFHLTSSDGLERQRNRRDRRERERFEFDEQDDDELDGLPRGRAL